MLKAAKRGQLAPGYFLISNFKNLGITSSNGAPVPMTGQGGPVMYDSKMSPVWIHGVPDNVYSLNFRTQTYNGKPALSWWEGNVTPTGVTLSGTDYVVNQNYKIVAKLTGQDGWIFSPHEFVITGGHFAWVTAYKNVPKDLVPYGGVLNGTLTDTAVQEYDLNTGKLVYSWDAVEHIPLSESETNHRRRPIRPRRAPVGRVPPERDPADVREPVPGVDAQHVGRVSGRRELGEHHLDARRQGEHVLRARRMPPSSGSTTSSCSPTARSACSTTAAAASERRASCPRMGRRGAWS